VLWASMLDFLGLAAAKEIFRGRGNAEGPAIDEEVGVGFGVLSEKLVKLSQEEWVWFRPLGC